MIFKNSGRQRNSDAHVSQTFANFAFIVLLEVGGFTGSNRRPSSQLERGREREGGRERGRKREREMRGRERGEEERERDGERK
jgi:hypothetical protein